MSVNVELEMSNRGYEEVAEFGDYDYSWSIVKIFKKDGRLFALEDSGCSCYGYGDSWDDPAGLEGNLYELTSLASAKARLDAYIGDSNSSYEDLHSLGLR